MKLFNMSMLAIIPGLLLAFASGCALPPERQKLMASGGAGCVTPADIIPIPTLVKAGGRVAPLLGKWTMIWPGSGRCTVALFEVYPLKNWVKLTWCSEALHPTSPLYAELVNTKSAKPWCRTRVLRLNGDGSFGWERGNGKWHFLPTESGFMDVTHTFTNTFSSTTVVARRLPQP